MGGGGVRTMEPFVFAILGGYTDLFLLFLVIGVIDPTH